MKRNRLRDVMFCALISACLVSGCANPGALPRHVSHNLEAMHLSGIRQVLYLDPGTPSLPEPVLYPLQFGVLGWEPALPPIPANVGRNGIAPPLEKREGDGRTPSGMFPLSRAFGYAPSFDGGLPYTRVDTQDLWVDDPQSPDYNRWVWRGETAASSFEELLRPDPLYRHALVPEYNASPVVRGLGSAIFVHVQGGKGAATAGCVSLPEEDLVRVMRWLDPEAKPQLFVGTEQAVEVAIGGSAVLIPDDLPPGMSARLKEASRLYALRRGSGFFAVAAALPPQVERQMIDKGSWRPGCPVPPADLSYVVSAYWGFDGKPHYGELVLHASLAAFVIDSLHHAFNGRFPIERMDLIEEFDADDFRSMAANNTSAFNCREVPGKPGVFSRHAYGAAIDVNPLQNPYLLVEDAAGKGVATAAAALSLCRSNAPGCRILPAAAAPYLERGDQRPGMLQPRDTLLTPLRERGFAWGGSWRVPDYQHFEYDLKRLLPGS